MSQLSYTDFYLFDIFDLKNTNEVINDLNQKLGACEEISGIVSMRGSTTREINETKYHWKIHDFQKILNEVKEQSDLVSDITLASSAISRIDMVGIKNDDLPYFVLLMLVSVDDKKLSLDKFFDDSESILRPLQIYMEEFGGIVRQLRSEKPICPYFIDGGILISKKELGEISTILSEMVEAEGIPHESVKMNYINERVTKLRKLSPLNNLKFDSNLLSVPGIHGNTIFFTGHVQQIGFNGLMTPFFLKFFYENIGRPDLEKIGLIRIRPYGYDGLASPWGTSNGMIFLISTYAWALYLQQETIRNEEEFNALRKKIHSSINSADRTMLEEYVMELNLNRINIGNYLSKIEKLKRIFQSSLSEFIRGGKSYVYEIPIPPASKISYLYIWRDIKESLGSGAYLQGLAKITLNVSDNIESILNQIRHENEIFHESINNIVQLRSQKANEKTQNTLKITGVLAAGAVGITALATIAILLFTGSLVELTDQLLLEGQTTQEILDKMFLAQNFSPNLRAEGTDINLPISIDNNMWSLHDTITVFADSNNFLEFTVIDVIVVDHAIDCFFESGPIVKLNNPQTITLQSNEQSGEIKQEIRIEYTPKESFDMEELTAGNSPNQSIVSLIFLLDVKNLQTGDIYPLRSENVRIWQYIPGASC